MDASFMEDHNKNRRQENLASHSTKAMHALSSIELGDTGDKQQSGKCHHFSIRGYVSEVRKTNREICWPFQITDNHHKLEKHADLLPPMVVTEFRWWDCKTCLHRAHVTKAAIENGITKNSQNSENIVLTVNGTSLDGSPVVEAHAHPPSSLSDFQITPGETILGGTSVEADSSINGKDGHPQPSVSCCEKDKESINAGIYSSGVHFGQASQNLLSKRPGCGGMTCNNIGKGEMNATEIRKAAIAFETQKTGGIIAENGTANISGSTTSISDIVLLPVAQSEKVMLQGENAHNVVTNELEETKLESKVSETELNSRILASISNHKFVFGPNNDASPRKRDTFETQYVPQGVNSSVQSANKCDTVGLEGSNNKESKCTADSVKNQDDSQGYPSQLDTLNVNLHRKKTRKVRMLNDIIKSEALGLSRQSHLSNGNDAVQSRDDGKSDPAASKDGKSSLSCNLDVVCEEKESVSFINNKRKVLPDSDDEGPSLIHWLRRMPKKVKTQKCDENALAGNSIVTSQSLTYASSGKCLHSRTRLCGTVQGINDKSLEVDVPMNITRVGAVHPHVKWQQVVNVNNHAVADVETAKCINVGKAFPKLATNHHNFCPGREQIDGSCKDFVIHKKKDTPNACEYEISSPVNGLKVSSPRAFSSNSQEKTLRQIESNYGIIPVHRVSSDTSEYASPSIYKGCQHISKKRGMKGRIVSPEESTGGAPLVCEVAAVRSIKAREKQASVLIREKQDPTPIRKKMVAVSEKQADSPVREKQAVVDGIPIEILELLQSNYHKNHQLNSARFTTRVIENHELNSGHSTPKVIEPSEANKNVRDGSLGRLSNITGCDPDAVPYSQHKNKLEMYSKSVNTGSGACAIGKHAGNSTQELRAQTSHCSGKRRKLVKVKEGQGTATFRECSDVHLCLAPPTSGIQPPNTEPYGTYCSQNYSWNRTMLQNVESQYNALAISRQHPCRCFLHGPVQINNSHKIHSGIYNSSLLPQTIQLERNPTKVTQDSGGLRVADTSLSHLHRTKQKNDVKNKRMLLAGNACAEAAKSGKECSSKVTQPLDLYTNDSISAMHLLRLMDPAVGSASSSLCPTVSNDQADFLSKFKHCENDYQKDFVGVDMDMRTKYTFNCLGPSEYQTYTQINSSNLMSPVPRYGALESFSQKRILSGSNNFNALYEFKGINQSEVGLSLKSGRKEKRKSSHIAIPPKLTEQRLLSGDRHSQDQPQLMLNSAGYPKLSEERENGIHLGYKNREAAKVPVRSSCQTELCVVNRNPADFSVPDENNVYMISYEDLKPRHVSPKRKKQHMVYPDTPKQQRIPQLAASKWNLRC